MIRLLDGPMPSVSFAQWATGEPPAEEVDPPGGHQDDDSGDGDDRGIGTAPEDPVERAGQDGIVGPDGIVGTDEIVETDGIVEPDGLRPGDLGPYELGFYELRPGDLRSVSADNDRRDTASGDTASGDTASGDTASGDRASGEVGPVSLRLLQDRSGTDSPADGAARPAIDPRFVERWVEARREEGKRRLRIGLVGSALVVLVVVAVASFFTPVLKVRHVRVSVAGSTPPSSVVDLAGLGGQTLMLHADPGAIAHRLDAVPTLGGARVSRSWPGTVSISVATRSPIAVVAIQNGLGTGSWAEVDPTGRVLSYPVSPPPGMPVISGLSSATQVGRWLPGSAGPRAPVGGSGVDMSALSDGPDVPSGLGLALAVVVGLNPALRADLQQMTVNPKGAVTFAVLPADMATGAIPVQLGDGSQLAEKLAGLASLLTSGDLTGVTSLDLSVPDRPTAVLR
jgi:POTRA domain, FtsQ-type/Cell division protein FtsQ